MHTKDKGSIGELTVAANLIAQGFSVFTELGDNSKSDLIIVDRTDYRTYKVQVKYRKAKGDVVQVQTKKSGPNYSFSYEAKHADVYAIFIPTWNEILYINRCMFCNNASQLTFRKVESKNNQRKGCHFAKDFMDIREALRDCTQDTSANNVGGDGTVQTTTAKRPASES